MLTLEDEDEGWCLVVWPAVTAVFMKVLISYPGELTQIMSL